jgi:hypothetical protein
MNTSRGVNASRRRFIKITAVSVAAVPLGQLLLHGAAHAEDLPKLDEADPQAQALGYVHDATKADVSKFPKRAGKEGASQFCKNCQLFTGSADAEWGPCSIFPGKSVNANGWCSAWIKKAG